MFGTTSQNETPPSLEDAYISHQIRSLHSLSDSMFQYSGKQYINIQHIRKTHHSNFVKCVQRVLTNNNGHKFWVALFKPMCSSPYPTNYTSSRLLVFAHTHLCTCICKCLNGSLCNIQWVCDFMTTASNHSYYHYLLLSSYPRCAGCLTGKQDRCQNQTAACTSLPSAEETASTETVTGLTV